MAPGPGTLGRMLIAAAALAEAEQADIATQQIAFKLRRRFQPIGPVPGMGVAKLVQYDVLAPPDNAVNIAKFVQYDVLLPPNNAVNIGKLVQYDVLVPPDNAVDVGKLVQYVALVPPDNAVTVAKIVQYAVLDAPPPIPRPLLWNSAPGLSDLSGDIAPAPILRKQNGAVPTVPVSWLPRPQPVVLMAAAAMDPIGTLWPLWRRAASSGAETRYPLPAPSVALFHVRIANNLPDDDPSWVLWTRRFAAADTYNQRLLPVRLLFWRLGTAPTFPEPRVDLRKFVQKGRPPFNEYDPVIIFN